MKRSLLAILVACSVGLRLAAQTPTEETSDPPTSTLRLIQARAVVALATLPYCVDLAWQIPLGSRVSWLTASAANPDPVHSPAHVLLVRGSGTVFSPGFGDLCTTLRRAGIWTEDLGPVGDRWICEQLIGEQRAGRLTGSIILVGHSRGGRHVLDAARRLQSAGINVDLLVCLDAALLPRLPANVRQAVNIYVSGELIYPPDRLKPAPGTNVRIDNIDLSDPASPIRAPNLHHLNITASPAVQEFIQQRIMQVIREASGNK